MLFRSKKAFEYYMQAAEAGGKMGAYNVGCCYRSGSGVKKDKLKAAEWYEKAASAGDTDAMLMLGKMYERGEVGKDLDKARYWYKLALDGGAEIAEYILNKKKLSKV